MSKIKGFVYGGVSAATYGLIPLFTLPVMAKGVGLDTILCYRFFMAASLLAGILILRKENFRVSRKELVTLLGLGGLFAFSATFLFWSYQLMAAGISATILFLYPVFVALIMAIFFREKISWVTNLAILIALTGVALLYLGDGDGKVSLAGIGVVLMSAIAYALYIVVINKSNVQHMGGLKLTFYSMSIAMVLFFIKAQFTGGLQQLPDWTAAVDLAFLALIPTVISCVTMVYSIQYIGSTYTAVLGAMEPVTAVAVGIWVFHDPFTTNLAFGILLIIVSVTLIIMSGFLQSLIGKLAINRS